jgi:predicted RND superfamily exporter protein
MQYNVGKADKVVRIIIGVVIIALGLYFKSWWGAIGLVPLLTALIGWCPVYVPFGIKTCKTEEKQQPTEQ